MKYPKHNQRVGRRGEDDAVRFLKKLGMKILERNYRSGKSEIDIIASEGETLVFVEVKTCTGSAFGFPESWIDRQKQKHLIHGAENYLLQNDCRDIDCRFDVIAIRYKSDEKEISHIRDAFWAD